MTIVGSPLTRRDAHSGRPERVGRRLSTQRAMEAGQHLMAITLSVIGVIRAVNAGTPLVGAIVAGLAVIVWHTFGVVLLPRASTPRVVTGWLLGFAGVWLGAVAVSSEFVWLAFLLWLLAGHLLPLLWGAIFSFSVLGVVVIAPVLHHGTTAYANIFGPLIGGIFAFGISRGYLQLLRDAAERERLVASLTQTQSEMAELQGELAVAQRQSGAIAERTRISRDLHDTVAQALSSIRLISHAGVASDPTVPSSQTLARVEALASESLSDVRRIVAALAPAELENDALANALERVLVRTGEESSMSVTFRVDDSLPALATEVEVALLRTAQSALANVRKHSSASRIVMSLIDAGTTVRLDIIDDGVGFDVAQWERDDAAGSSHYGLRFMRARLRELGGGLDVESAPGDGTALSIHLPMVPHA